MPLPASDLGKQILESKKPRTDGALLLDAVVAMGATEYDG
jgi:hypothetical protein